ncbi:hypothetical protein KM043_016734 [Ampulex compressa]|nr:hypothetical protein KM043_016734 [Ampulex compressa]
MQSTLHLARSPTVQYHESRRSGEDSYPQPAPTQEEAIVKIHMAASSLAGRACTNRNPLRIRTENRVRIGASLSLVVLVKLQRRDRGSSRGEDKARRCTDLEKLRKERTVATGLTTPKESAVRRPSPPGIAQVPARGETLIKYL